MPFQKGVSGNKSGRPKQTPEQRADREHFKELLKASTVSALENIIQIANDKYSKDRFKANAYLIDKAYGANTALLVDSAEDEPILIKVVPCHKKDDDEDWEQEWNEAPDNEEE